MSTSDIVSESKWKKYNQKKGIKSKREKCEILWQKIIRYRAGYSSELSRRNFVDMTCHRILGKETLALRFSFENGIFITRGECSLNQRDKELLFKQIAKVRGNFREKIENELNVNINRKSEQIITKQDLTIDEWLDFLKGETRRLGIGK